VDQEEKPPERPSISKFVPDWRPTREQVLWMIWITVVVIVVLLLLYGISRLFRIEFMNLLKVVAVPITVGAAVPLLNWLQKTRELAVANQRGQDEALQAYLDQMSQLLLDKDRPLLNQLQKKGESGADSGESARIWIPSSKNYAESARSKESTLARARTLTVLTRLDGRRKRSVVDFLFEARLIGKNSKGLGDWPLKEADLREAHLSEAHLVKTNLSYARLSEADLERADLRGADLHGANLSKAVLSGARLGPPPREDEDAEPNPTPADLSSADLSGADLSEANVSQEQLAQARTLEGATMPNGQKYEDWLVTPEGLHWFRKYKRNLGTNKKRKGVAKPG
jgi:uncharacterized protein YjbI with pentapeptide repeats